MKSREFLRGVSAGIALISFSLMPSMAPAAERQDLIYQRAEQYKDEALTTLGRLVNIDSGTGDTAGVNATATIVTEELKALGAHVDVSPNSVGEGDNYV